MSRQPKPKPPHKLHLTTNSLRNTTMSVEDDSIFFEIVTRFWHPHVTKINKTDMDSREVNTVAEIERIPGREPRIRFGEKAEWMSATDFVKYDAENQGGTFVGGKDTTYRWKTHNGRFQLIRADDEEKVPVAEFHPHRRHFFVFRMSRHAFLEIKPVPEVTEALDRLITSYLLVERRRRDTRVHVKLERS